MSVRLALGEGAERRPPPPWASSRSRARRAPGEHTRSLTALLPSCLLVEAVLARCQTATTGYRALSLITDVMRVRNPSVSGREALLNTASYSEESP